MHRTKRRLEATQILFTEKNYHHFINQLWRKVCVTDCLERFSPFGGIINPYASATHINTRGAHFAIKSTRPQRQNNKSLVALRTKTLLSYKINFFKLNYCGQTNIFEDKFFIKFILHWRYLYLLYFSSLSTRTFTL